jgi:uncharacterized protein (UPF0332 family)
MIKADRACVSARLLLSAGDIDGACNRAYYAMFDAARAALLAINTDGDSGVSRTHSGLIAAFGQQLVKTGKVSMELGKLLNRAHEVRLVADYKGDSVELEDAVQMVGQAERFVTAMRERVE